MIIPLAHTTPHSYYYRITNEYFGILLILGLISVVIFSLRSGYFSYLITHLFDYPDVARKRKNANREVESTIMTKVLNTTLLMGSIALAILIMLKPYEGRVFEKIPFLKYDNYLIWFGLLLALMLLAAIRQLALEASMYFLQDSMVLRDWDQNTLNASFLTSFGVLLLCMAYILGYMSVDVFQYLLIILLSMSLILRGLISASASSRFNIVGRINFFLYLCTLEILPVLVGLKFVLNLVA